MNSKDSSQPKSSTYQILVGDGCTIPVGALIPVELFTQFVQGLVHVGSDLRDIIILKYLGSTYKEIGKLLRISTQLAEMRHKRALREWPAFEAFFPDKVTKRARRSKSL